ncbi:hypothetical protein C8R44DRAFT_978227 [Mycena epipterygia]|nr:hypothetical protein C8R44DRAFT_978227 [Mycena epipterygia]
MANFPLVFSINTNLTPIFVPTPLHILVIESYFGLGGPGLASAFLYNPTNPNVGIAVNDMGRLAPVLEARWRDFERAVAGAQTEAQHPQRGGGSWSRPQNTTCPTDMFYDLGPADSDTTLVRFRLGGHTVSARYGYPDDVQWYTPTEEIKTVDAVPEPYLKVERIIRGLADELFAPWDWSQPHPPVPDELRPILRAIHRMARIRHRWGRGY